MSKIFTIRVAEQEPMDAGLLAADKQEELAKFLTSKITDYASARRIPFHAVEAKVVVSPKPAAGKAPAGKRVALELRVAQTFEG